MRSKSAGLTSVSHGLLSHTVSVSRNPTGALHTRPDLISAHLSVHSVFDLKAQLQTLTNVPPERQKILGLVKGKLPPEQERMYVILLRWRCVFLWAMQRRPQAHKRKEVHLGGHSRWRRAQGSLPFVSRSLTRLCSLTQISDLEFLPDVVNDLDVDFSADPAAALAYKNDQRNKRKIREAIEKLELNIINPLRKGKKLLVLDIDYSKAPSFSSLFACLRPTKHSHRGHQATDFRSTPPFGVHPTSITRYVALSTWVACR
jgi:hypothetical protein